MRNTILVSTTWLRILLFGVFTTICIPLILLEALLAKRVRAMNRIWGPISLFLLGVKVHVHGAENVKDGPYVILSNHQSRLDSIVIASSLPIRVKIVSKKEVLKYPLLGAYLKRSQHVFIDRSDSLKAFAKIRKAIGELRRGEGLLIFPEGTVGKKGEALNFKRGIFWTLIKQKVSVLPVTLTDTWKLVGTKKTLYYPSPVNLTIHPALDVSLWTRGNEAVMDDIKKTISVGLNSK